MKRGTIIFAAIFVGLLIALSLGRLAHHHILEFIYSRQPAASSSCIANLKQIDGAKYAWALENHKTTNDTPTAADLFGPGQYIRAMPICPKGGTYFIGPVWDKPRCSVPQHTI